jgi:hypothetical protein
MGAEAAARTEGAGGGGRRERKPEAATPAPPGVAVVWLGFVVGGAYPGL